MKTHRIAPLAVALSIAFLGMAPALTTAQTATKKASVVVAKRTAVKPKKRTINPNQRTDLKSATRNVAAGIGAAEAALTPEELAIAERVHVGSLPCEMGASVTLSADPKTPGHFNLQGKNFSYRMFPVMTSTGAVRLEDPKAGAVWLQLANKSMLMNQKQGVRLADECMSPTQVAMAQSLKTNPAASIFESAKSAPVAPAPVAPAPVDPLMQLVPAAAR
jgi:hypothetical protein